MALKFYTDIDFNQNEIKNVKFENLAVAPVGATAGSFYFDTVTEHLRVFNGSIWETIASVDVESVHYRGAVAIGAAVAPVTPAVGDLYIFTGAAGSMTDASWGAAQNVPVESGDLAIYNGAEWDIIQGNTVTASETAPGVIELATQAEVDTGTDTTRAVTPATLEGKLASYTGKHTQTATLVAATPFNINHNLSGDVTVNVYNSAGELIVVKVNIVDADNLTITSSAALTNVLVVVVG